MTKNFLFIALLFLISHTSIYSQQIAFAEYFFDSDPGLGNGTAISITPNDTVTHTANITVSSLTSGFHNLFIRTKNTLGVWSHYEGRTFYVTPPTPTVTPQPQLVLGEWFLDTDPGLGNATSFTFTPGDTISKTIVPNIGALAYGSSHNLFIRVKDIAGTWSHYEGRPFTVCPGVPSFTGAVSSSAGPVSGNIILYKHESFLTLLDSIDSVPIQANGSYGFGPVTSGTYIAKAVPTATNMQVSYAPGAISWQGAALISYSCATTYTQNIVVQTFTTLPAGSGVLAGKIKQGDGFGKKTTNVMQPGQPIGGIIVKGGRNPGGSMFAQTITDTTGYYSFGNVPPGDYFILVDIPGLDTNLTYHPTITVTNNSFTNLNFIVDSMLVNPIPGSDVGIRSLEKLNDHISVYPNPFYESITVAITNNELRSYTLSMIDVLGKQVVYLNDNKPTQTIKLSELPSGIYYLSITEDNGNRAVKKLIKH